MVIIFVMWKQLLLMFVLYLITSCGSVAVKEEMQKQTNFLPAKVVEERLKEVRE